VAGGPPRWLLIGNSRWHWALAGPAGLRIEHQMPPAWALEPGILDDLVGWAAVGPLPASVALPPERQLLLEQVPLAALPPWLGLDRALAGWLAWRRQGRGVLVADAGTVLSLTRVEGSGRFAGGRLLAGVGLQLQAMAAGTAALPRLELPLTDPPAGPPSPDLDWPTETHRAMVTGVVRGLAAAVADAAREAHGLETGCHLVVSGGDGALLLPRLQVLLAGQGVTVELQSDLALEALVQLQPNAAGDAPAQARPRSVRI
jgi:type III pantothenate kinase